MPFFRPFSNNFFCSWFLLSLEEMGEISEGLCREFHSSKTLGFTLCGVVPLSILQSMQKEKKKRERKIAEKWSATRGGVYSCHCLLHFLNMLLSLSTKFWSWDRDLFNPFYMSKLNWKKRKEKTWPKTMGKKEPADKMVGNGNCERSHSFRSYLPTSGLPAYKSRLSVGFGTLKILVLFWGFTHLCFPEFNRSWYSLCCTDALFGKGQPTVEA